MDERIFKCENNVSYHSKVYVSQEVHDKNRVNYIYSGKEQVNSKMEMIL